MLEERKTVLSAGPTGKNNFTAEPEGFKLPLVRVWEALVGSSSVLRRCYLREGRLGCSANIPNGQAAKQLSALSNLGASLRAESVPHCSGGDIDCPLKSDLLLLAVAPGPLSGSSLPGR